MTIRFLATGETQRDVAFNFLAGRSTVSSILSEVSEALWLVLQPPYLRHPSITDEWMKISQEFHERWNIPHCLGAIDGNCCLLCVMHNTGSYTWNWGTLEVKGPLPYFFVREEAFPLKEYVMGPYARRTLHEDKSYERRVFNYRMSRARHTIENTFGILAQRSPQHPPLPIAPPGATDSEDWEGHLSPESWRDEEAAGGVLIPSRPTGCNTARYAKKARDKLAHYLAADGQVSLAGQNGEQHLRRTRCRHQSPQPYQRYVQVPLHGLAEAVNCSDENFSLCI
ncbi:hypothetical protein MRX96_039202 [Rhipicephalus microplus]